MPSTLHPSPFTPLLLAGPTAVGKSDIALLLAGELNGEIISVDSMQVYRGLDLGTAKPTPAERARVPHHLIDVVEHTEPFDAAQFARLARATVQDIQSRRHVPILCGGTGFYFKAFLEGLGDSPPANAALRAELESTPLAEQLRELEQRDPVTFQKIDRQNPRRVIRALEVIRLTGKPFSTQRADWQSPSTLNPQLFTASPAPPPTSTPASTPAWTKCSRAASSPKRSAFSTAASRKTQRRCKPSATARSSSTCVASAHWPTPLSW